MLALILNILVILLVIWGVLFLYKILLKIPQFSEFSNKYSIPQKVNTGWTKLWSFMYNSTKKMADKLYNLLKFKS